MPEHAPPTARPPLLILSVATGYGNAERTIETLLPLLLAERRVVIFAADPLHLERLRHFGHPGLKIHEVIPTRANFLARAARRLFLRVLTLRPSAILVNTPDSLRMLIRTARWLPGLDSIACLWVHDVPWPDHAELLPRIPRATLLVSDRSMLEETGSMARHAWPHGPMRALVMPNPIDIPADRLGDNGRARGERDFATPRVLTQLTDVLDGRWCRRPLALPAGAAQSGPAILFDVSLALDKGWHSPVGISRVEHHTAERLAARPVAVRLVRRGSNAEGYRRLTGQELEFLANGNDGMASLANAELADVPPRGARLTARCLAKSPGDVLLSVSNPWDHLPPPVFRSLRTHGVRVVLAVHDLMVWETPQWTAGRDPRQYSDDMISILAEADQLVAVSQHTARVTQRALAADGRAVPPLRVAYPAGLETGRAVPDGPPVGLPPDRPFVLYCSTIEIRKNHILLLNVWEQLRQQLPRERLPVLVLAGRWGWGVDAVRLAVERNWRLAPDIRVAPSLRDEQLHWLYRHARFSVFPSFTEGFGLPVAESLAAGTPVVLANHPALIEASAGLMPALDPGDLPAWLTEIRRLCLDDAYLAQVRDRARTYQPAAPDDLPRALLDAAGVAP